MLPKDRAPLPGAADEAPSVLAAVSNALVALHKQQFGRGPTRARTEFAGRDMMICRLDDALLPAERAMVQMGRQIRVQESRIFLQEASSDRFRATVERITGRRVHSFTSATDPVHGIVYEIFAFEPCGGGAGGVPES